MAVVCIASEQESDLHVHIYLQPPTKISNLPDLRTYARPSRHILDLATMSTIALWLPSRPGLFSFASFEAPGRLDWYAARRNPFHSPCYRFRHRGSWFVVASFAVDFRT